MHTPVVMFPIDLEQLQSLIRNTVQEAVRAITVPSDIDSQPEVLTKKEAMKLLGNMSVPTFDNLVKAGKIHQFKPSRGRVVFLRSDLMNYIVQTKVIISIN